MTFRPTWYPCSNTAPHEQHDHTDGPDTYMYRCSGGANETTYTAAEVKVLTEEACKVAGEAGRLIGRKEALEEVAREMGVDRWDDEPRKYVTVQIDWDTYNLLQEALGATSDATSGVPGHQEVSEAVRSPQERCGHPTCPCNAEEAR